MEKNAQIKIPTDNEIRELKDVVSERNQSLTDVWRTMDGLNYIWSKVRKDLQHWTRDNI